MGEFGRPDKTAHPRATCAEASWSPPLRHPRTAHPHFRFLGTSAESFINRLCDVLAEVGDPATHGVKFRIAQFDAKSFQMVAVVHGLLLVSDHASSRTPRRA